jgi:hypothetical protein
LTDPLFSLADMLADEGAAVAAGMLCKREGRKNRLWVGIGFFFLSNEGRAKEIGYRLGVESYLLSGMRVPVDADTGCCGDAQPYFTGVW